MAAFDDLNDRQRKFVLAYIDSGVGYKSAIDAGYSEKGASQQASELLANPKIKAAMKEKQDEIDEWLRGQFKNAAKDAFKVLKMITNDPDANNRDKISAAKDLLDRAGHKPTERQEIAGKDGGDLIVRFVDPE